MSKKDSRTTCDYINFVEASEKGKELMRNQKTNIFGFYIIVAINTGLRISDIRRITYEDLTKGMVKFKEQKTKKYVEIPLNESVQKAVKKLNHFSFGDVFKSQKRQLYSTQQINLLLKKAFEHLLPTHCISSHSLRKTFGRKVYEKYNRTEDALNYLSELFNHSSLSYTRKYLGIRKEELKNIYLSL